MSSILDITALDSSNGLYPPNPKPGKPQRIYGNCNGLLCVRVDSTLVLYNPTTRKSKRVPDSGTDRSYNHFFSYGLCYHELDDDYRVVELRHFQDINEDIIYGMKIYSLRTNSWREINDYFYWSAFVRSLFIDNGVLNQTTTNYADVSLNPGLSAGGLLHWAIVRSFCQILVVDTVTNTYETLAGPKFDNEGGYEDWGIMDFGGYLGVYHKNPTNRFHIWIMKGSWTKVVSLTSCAGLCGLNDPLVGLKDGEILLRRGPGISICNSKEDSFMKQVISELCDTRAIPSPVYIESLVAPSFEGE